MAYVERCGKVWRARWLLADGRHYGSQCGFATMRVAKRFAEDREARVRWPAQEVEAARLVPRRYPRRRAARTHRSASWTAWGMTPARTSSC
ncbi:hypothetical protein KGA66_20220 [Actinocrinis puniceicyclus]|uniref:Uncharacterized protein n=1 Tax=Actinocrinis puniceicyclus TaxID=977794 RepID=A0A8J7WQ11_9ACTN|nr:hypothetical protein [Actinocrinis puniceicyclus]MBS2965388.1 hypothetical protein [Actinocrinis puniceicyclus]